MNTNVLEISGYDDDMNKMMNMMNLSGDSQTQDNEIPLHVSCKPTVNAVIPILFLLIATVGLAANIVVIYIIVILKEYQKTVTNMYVVQLAIADFLFLFILPFQAKTLLQGHWDYGDVWCKIMESIRMLNYYSSILFLTVMSVDRFLAINFAMNPKVSRFRTKVAVGIISAIIWISGFLCVIWIMIKAQVVVCNCQIVFGEESFEHYAEDYGSSSGIDEYVDEDDFNGKTTLATYAEHEAFQNQIDILKTIPGFCSYKDEKEISLWIITNFLAAFVLPLLIICACYAQILRKISQPMTVAALNGARSSSLERRWGPPSCLKPNEKTWKHVTYRLKKLWDRKKSYWKSDSEYENIGLLETGKKVNVETSFEVKTGLGTKSHKSNKTRKRVTHMVIGLVSVFIICWLPYHAFNLSRVNDSQLSHNACDAIQHFTLVFAYLSSALNPFLYTFIGTNFRQRWHSAIGRTRSFRPSFGSRSEYAMGHAKRRKLSRISLTGNNQVPDDTLSQSNVTKHTVVPMNNIVIKPVAENTA